MKERVRILTRRTVGRSIGEVCGRLRGYLLGWKQYFRLAHTPHVFASLDEWIRHRLRAIHLKQWRRSSTIYRELQARGLSGRGAAKVATNGRRWWRNSAKLINVGLSHPLLRRPRRAEARRVTSTLRTVRCGPACQAVWHGTRGITSGPYADLTERSPAEE
jgi:Group II intron, maturase-specific domain